MISGDKSQNQLKINVANVLPHFVDCKIISLSEGGTHPGGLGGVRFAKNLQNYAQFILFHIQFKMCQRFLTLRPFRKKENI